MSNMIFTLPNTADLGTIIAGSTAPGSSVLNLQAPQITSVWKSALDLLPGALTPWIVPAGGAAPLVYPSSRALLCLPPQVGLGTFDPTVSAVSLVADAARPITGTGVVRKFRVRAWNSLNASATHLLAITRPAPGTPYTVTNLTGALSTANVWLQAPNSWLAATSMSSNTQCSIPFNASQTDGGTLPLKAGAGLQTFVVWVRKSAGAGNPTLAIDLVQGASVVANLCAGVAVNTVNPGVPVIVQWNASLLSGLGVTNVGLRLTGTANGTATVEFANAEWIAEHNGYTYDSGDVVVSYPVFTARQASRVFNLAVVLPAPFTLQNYAVGHVDSILIDQLSTADAYAQAGRLVAANIVQPFGNMDWGWAIGWDDKSPSSETPGGQEWFEVRPKRRLGELACALLTEAEGYDKIFSQLQGTYGVTGNFLWIPDPGNPAEFYNQVIWGRFDGLSPVKNPRLRRYTQSYKIREVL